MAVFVRGLTLRSGDVPRTGLRVVILVTWVTEWLDIVVEQEMTRVHSHYFVVRLLGVPVFARDNGANFVRTANDRKFLRGE